MSDKPHLIQVGNVNERMTARLNAEFVVHKWFDVQDKDALLAEVGDKVIAISTDGHWGVPDNLFERLANLRVVSSYGVGYDGIDTDAAVRHNVLVAHTPNVLNDEVADTAIMLWLAVSRGLVRADAWVRSGAWESKGAFELTRSIQKRTVGILGMGRIGETIAKRAAAFDAKIVYHSRTSKPVPYDYYDDLTAMARDCDVLMVITPGGAATKHLVNAEVLEALGPDGILINVARGSVVDEAALVDALQSGKLGAAGLDVFEAEPKVPQALKAMDNVVLLPHVGSATIETRRAMGDLTCDNLSQYLRNGTVITAIPECAHLNNA
jgi:lactate dehydrogenase-like 2-hydroxyacid dehydrogenase